MNIHTSCQLDVFTVTSYEFTLKFQATFAGTSVPKMYPMHLNDIRPNFMLPTKMFNEVIKSSYRDIFRTTIENITSAWFIPNKRCRKKIKEIPCSYQSFLVWISSSIGRNPSILWTPCGPPQRSPSVPLHWPSSFCTSAMVQLYHPFSWSCPGFGKGFVLKNFDRTRWWFQQLIWTKYPSNWSLYPK